MILLLVVAIIASLIAGETIDALAIVFIVLVDVIMGTYQENKANNTAEALSNLVTVKTIVLRDGKEIEIDSSDLVVGDIIVLDSGDKISADARVIEAHNLTVDESILTGESINVVKTPDVIKKENPISGDTGFFHNIENEQKNYLVITTKYLVTLQNNSGFVICNTD